MGVGVGMGVEGCWLGWGDGLGVVDGGLGGVGAGCDGGGSGGGRAGAVAGAGTGDEGAPFPPLSSSHFSLLLFSSSFAANNASRSLASASLPATNPPRNSTSGERRSHFGTLERRGRRRWVGGRDLRLGLGGGAR